MRSAHIPDVAAEALEDVWQLVRQRGRGFAKLRISERHELRKTLKTMRYASDYLMPVYPGPDSRTFFERLRGLQNVFGYLNDVAMAEELARTIAADHPKRSDLNKSVKRICKWHDRTRAKADAQGGRALAQTAQEHQVLALRPCSGDRIPACVGERATGAMSARRNTDNALSFWIPMDHSAHAQRILSGWKLKR